MKRLSVFLSVILAINVASAGSEREALPENYEKALELIHAFSGAGDELQRATELANALLSSHPDKGYAQALQAEMLSTWRLNQQGQPEALRAHILYLADEALRLNPRLAQAHVARGRALLRASDYDQAGKAIDAALKIDPGLVGAYFLRAEILRRTKRVSEAETWYLKFIEHTPSATRKSNAYYWLAMLYRAAAWDQPTQWATFVAKARAAHEKMIELDPNGAWKLVNFAIFLNNEAADFQAAELYAQSALNIMEFPMARYHLAIARYQKLLSATAKLQGPALKEAAAQVRESTGVSLEEAIEFSRSSPAMLGRLERLHARL